MKRWKFRIACCLVLLCIQSIAWAGMSALAEESLGETRHVDEVLESEYVTLILSADVQIPDGALSFPIYTSDYPPVDDALWCEAFFGSADAPVTDELEGADLEDEGIARPEFHRVLSMGDIFTLYSAREARLSVSYGSVEYLSDWHAAQEGAQAEGLETTPDEARAAAQIWIDSLRTLGWDGFQISACYAMPAAVLEEPMGAFYIVEFTRELNGIPLAFDYPPRSGSIYSQVRLYGDVMKIYINDQGIFRAEGYCRSYSETNTVELSVSLDDAIAILRDNMDYVNASNESSTFEVTEIGLCYRLVQQLPSSDPDVQAKAEARPVWRFSSGINRNQTDTFTMFVDAATGEVLP